MSANKVALITGATRGIGRTIAMRLSDHGYDLVITGKTTEPHPKLPNTIHSVADEITLKGGKAIPVCLDVRCNQSIDNAVLRTIDEYGRLDLLINNASAIDNSGTLSLTEKKYDLMHNVNGRGTFMMTQAALPYLLKSPDAHVLTMSPPLNMDPAWFHVGGVAYTAAKYSMSMCTLGMSHEFRGRVRFNSLWPRYTIATSAIDLVGGSVMRNLSMKPEMVADAAFEIIQGSESGKFYLDTDVLHDTDRYKVNRALPTFPDLYVGDAGWFSTLKRWLEKRSAT